MASLNQRLMFSCSSCTLSPASSISAVSAFWRCGGRFLTPPFRVWTDLGTPGSAGATTFKRTVAKVPGGIYEGRRLPFSKLIDCSPAM